MRMLENAPRPSSGDSKEGTAAAAQDPPMATLNSRPKAAILDCFMAIPILPPRIAAAVVQATAACWRVEQI
jgi:hypothetical protein